MVLLVMVVVKLMVVTAEVVVELDILLEPQVLVRQDKEMMAEVVTELPPLMVELVVVVKVVRPQIIIVALPLTVVQD
jgi:hypothetical protein